MTIWKDSTIARRMRITSTRTVETMDMTAMDAMAAAATETTAEGTMAAYLPGVAVTTTMWRRWWPQKTQPAMRGTQARVSNCQAGARGRLAGQTLRWQAGQARISPADSRGSVVLVMLVARGARFEALARLADVVEVAVPVAGHAGGNRARAVPGEVVRRSQGQRAARVRGGRRAEGRVWRTSEHLDVSELAVTLKRLQVFKLTLSAPVVKPSLGPS